jgi:flagellar motor switch/type III secretory pathway protein FliN
VDAAAPARPLEGSVVVDLAPSDASPGAPAIQLEVERALAAACVARAIRRAPPVVVDASAPADRLAGLAGAFAAVLVAAARRAHEGRILQVAHASAAASADAAAPALPAAGPEATTVSLTVVVGDDAYVARAVLPRRSIAAAPAPPWDTRALRGMGAVPLSLAVVACAWPSTVLEIGALREGDVVVPAGWRLEWTEAGGWRGTLWLSPPGASEGVRVDVGDRGGLVLRGELDSLCRGDDGRASERGAEGASMAESDATSALVESLGDVPVVVRVEIGEARMPAREWAALGRGDVIALGRRLGERVVLRVGGVAVARGELVDVEGEVGVRIGERLRDEGAADE